MNKKDNLKLMQFSSELHKLIETQYTEDALTNSDLQGIIEAMVLKIALYGRTME